MEDMYSRVKRTRKVVKRDMYGMPLQDGSEDEEESSDDSDDSDDSSNDDEEEEEPKKKRGMSYTPLRYILQGSYRP